LKSAQLQRIARATGIQSSGPKGALIERITAELGLHLPHSDGDGVAGGLTGSSPSTDPSQRQDQHVDCRSSSKDNCSSKGPTKTKGSLKANTHAKTNEKPWSILSIDMGIQNLAFAHLRVPRSAQIDTANPPIPELTAWHRLAVSDISSLNLTGLGDTIEANSQFTLAPSDALPKQEPTETKSKKLSKSKPTKKQESFSPDLYAVTAYNLITSLLTAYRPTHILIERQRFRTGGASAVQEWTLRVGVFEGMLYAILHALRMERGDVMAIHGVEPKRVVRYWLEPTSNKNEPEQEIVKLKSREVKKAKIDIVGRWLAAAYDAETNARSTLVPGVGASDKILLADRSESPVLHGIAGAYMRKWGGSQTKKGARAMTGPSVSSSPGSQLAAEDANVDIGKLDDLADCLLQGVAWVEWQIMRERIAREGVEALGVDEFLEIKSKRKSKTSPDKSSTTFHDQ
jgi:cruciform cutting endonuclease 1